LPNWFEVYRDISNTYIEVCICVKESLIYKVVQL
jgi:hypothetical protein